MSTTKLTGVEVECYAGYRGDETPRRLRRGETWIEIEEVRDRWHQAEASPAAPHADWFKIRTTSGSDLLLKHELQADLWYLAGP